MPLHGVKHSLAEQGKASTAIHLALNKLQFGHMFFNHAVFARIIQIRVYRISIFFYRKSFF